MTDSTDTQAAPIKSYKNIAIALNKAQAEMGGADKSANNPFFKSSYADLGSVIAAIKIPFANHGLSYSQLPVFRNDCAGVRTIILHISGEFLESELVLPMSKKDAQAVGSAITYARRYALQAMAGVPATDDDGEGAMQRTSKTTNTDDLPWFNDYDKLRPKMLEDIQAGKKTGKDIVLSLRNKFKVSSEVATKIEALS